MGGKVAVISFRFKDVDIIDVGLIVEDWRRFDEAKAGRKRSQLREYVESSRPSLRLIKTGN